jgi:hypothetical protein
VVNRSVEAPYGGGSRRGIETVRARLSDAARRGLDTVCAEFDARRQYEASMRTRFARATERGVLSLKEQLAVPGEHTPLSIVERLAVQLESALEVDA